METTNASLILPESLEKIVQEAEKDCLGEEETTAGAKGSGKDNDISNVTTTFKNTGLKEEKKKKKTKKKKKQVEHDDDRKPAATAGTGKAAGKNTAPTASSSSSSFASTAPTTEVTAATTSPTRYDDPITCTVRKAVAVAAARSSSSSTTATTPYVHRHRPVPNTVGREALGRIRGNTEGVKAAAAAVRACKNEVTLEVIEDGFVIKDNKSGDIVQVIKNKNNKKNRITMNEDGTITISDNDQDVDLLQKDVIEKMYHQSGVYECWNKGCTNKETKQNPFKECERCNNARYCCRKCQGM